MTPFFFDKDEATGGIPTREQVAVGDTWNLTHLYPTPEAWSADFADLQARLARTLDFLGGLKREQFADAATRTISLKVGGKDVELKGATYLSMTALPNFYFHMTTAYNILRHNGLEIGKGDFLGRQLS